MKKTLFFVLFLVLTALKIDPNASSFSTREKRRVDQYDFSGEYSQLEEIDIDATRKKNVELLITGSYPILKAIHFEGGFGAIKGELTGKFPQTKEVSISCTKADLDLNLEGEFDPSCDLIISGQEDMILHLPKEKNLLVIISHSPLGKIINDHPSLVSKKKRLTQKVYVSTQDEEAPFLKISIAGLKGTITLK